LSCINQWIYLRPTVLAGERKKNWMTHYFLGVDTGATKSHALIADDSGRALGFKRGGPGQLEIIGYEGLTEVLCNLIHQVLDTAGISKDQLAGAGFGLAGYDWPSQRKGTLAAIQSLEMPNVPFEIVNDTIIGLLAGATEGWGIAVVAGTSCNCRGWDRNRREGRVTGFSSRMGEAAGASELVSKAVQAVAFEWVRRGPPTRLTQAFIELTGAQNIEDLLESLTLKRHKISATAAPIVFRVAAEGDPVAKEVIRWTGRELGNLTVSVIRQLGFEDLDFEVILAGSLYNSNAPLLLEALQATIHAVAPKARLIRLNDPPVVGAVLLGMEQAGIEYAKVRHTLLETTNAIVEVERG
jgi:N-acetylglucosamine kinase-like BadF-type ATPase